MTSRLPAVTPREVVRRGAAGALVVSGLRPAPAGRTYEIWLVRAGERPLPAGLFPAGAATTRNRKPVAAALACGRHRSITSAG